MPCVLLVEDNDADARYIERRLATSETSIYSVIHVAELASALMVLRNKEIDVILLDLSLSDSNGVETVVATHREAPDVPILVLSGHEDLATAVSCVIEGAQGFLVKGETLTTTVLEREILFTMERNRKMNYVRKLLRATLSKHTSGSEILTAHVVAMEQAIDELTDYLRRNNPVSFEAVDGILKRHGVRDVLQELRSLTIITDSPEVSALHYATTAIEGLHGMIEDTVSRMNTLDASKTLALSKRAKRIASYLFVVGLFLGWLLTCLLRGSP